MKKYLFFVTLTMVTLLTSCSKDDSDAPVSKVYFTTWNQCDALTVLQGYVEDVTNPNSPNFIKEEDRIATFDMDGTFLAELYPTYFEYNMLEYRALDDPTYRDKAPEDVREAAQDIRDFVRKGTPLPANFDMKHARAAAKAYAGMTMSEFDKYVKDYAAKPANGFVGMTYGEGIYKPMLDVFEYLKDKGFTSYVCSGSDRFICRALVDPYNIFEPNRVIGMDVMLNTNMQSNVAGVNYSMGKEEYLVRSDSLLIKNLKTNKVRQIIQEIGKMPVLSFGNSSGDQAMHNYCLSNPKYRTAVFMLVADDDARDHASLTEAAKREAKWREAGYNVISMKNDFKTIYGPNVQKVDFVFPSN